MKTKALSFFLVSALAVGLTLVFAFPNFSQNNLNDQKTITRPALTQDLLLLSGEKILEIVEASYQITESTFHSGSCRVKNRSGQNITAIGLIWTVTFSDGEISQSQTLIDYRIHKDIVDAIGAKPFAPNEEKVIPNMSRESLAEGNSIERVKVEAAFAELEGSVSIGIDNTEIYEQLLRRREGVGIYKKWLEDIYGDDPNNIDRIVEKLSSIELPNDKKLEDDQVKQGAFICKQLMQDVLKNKGADSIPRFLKRK